MLCQRCSGSGFYVGNGYVRQDCDCDELRTESTSIKSVSIDKTSTEYRKAIKSLMLSCKCSKEEAMKMFDEQYEKIA